MGAPQIIKTPSGESLVVIPLSEYERLKAAAEDLDDIRVCEEAKRRLAAGEDELIPFEMVERLLDGENPVRVWREHRGLTVKALAERAGISAAYLSQLEGGQRDGSLDPMRKIDDACGEAGTPAHTPLRSEEARRGKEGGSTC